MSDADSGGRSMMGNFLFFLDVSFASHSESWFTVACFSFVASISYLDGRFCDLNLLPLIPE